MTPLEKTPDYPAGFETEHRDHEAVDLTRYRCPASYVVAIAVLAKLPAHALPVTVFIRNEQEAAWLEERLAAQGYRFKDLERWGHHVKATVNRGS
jgi:hypothetical protein